jgi:hypothetical protein
MLLVVLVLAVALPSAGADTRASTSPDRASATSVPRLDPPGDLIAFWVQTYDVATCQAYSSEHRAYPVYSCESADDFYSESGDTIVMVRWLGHDQTAEGIAEFILRFCEDDTTSRYHFPGTVVYEETILDFTAEFLSDLNNYWYSCDVPGGFAPNPGQVYWLSIIGVHSGSHGGHQWFWYECIPGDYWGGEGTLKSDFWGYPEWTPWSIRNYLHNPVEHVFELYSRGDTPVEDKSWAQIKAMFR